MSDSTICFPLRSNVEWFEDEDKYPLKKRIKEALILYDNLIFEAGSYICAITENGDIDFHVPPYRLSQEERKGLNFRKGRMSLSITNNETGKEIRPFNNEKLERFWGANFLNLIEELSLHDCDFVSLKFLQLNENGKRMIKENARDDLERLDIEPQPNGEYFLRKKAVEGLNHSLLLSSALDEPFVADEMHEKILRRKIKESWSEKLDLNKIEVIDSILELTLPDFSSLNVEELIGLRDDKALKNFREKIEKIGKESSKTSQPKEFREKAKGIFAGDLLDEIEEMAPNKKSVSLDILLGLFPYTEPITIARDANSLYKYSQSWLSFMMKIRSAGIE